jgi:hypothetical protein
MARILIREIPVTTRWPRFLPGGIDRGGDRDGAPRSLICDAWSSGMADERLGGFVLSQNIRRLSMP